MFMESQDKSIVMSSIVEILVYIRLHEKNEKKAFSKIRFHSGELSDWKVAITGEMFVESHSSEKKIVKFVIFNKHDGKGQGILFPAVWGTHFFWSRFKEEVKVKIP